MIKNTIVYLIGFAGTGKYTVAKELAKRNKFTLIDNQLINNPVFTVVRADGKTPLHPGVWREIRKIRDSVLNAVSYIADKESSFIFTNEILATKEGAKWYSDIEEVAEARRAAFLPVRLTCDEEEHLRRIESPDRELRLKETSAERLKERRELYELFKPDHPNLLELNVTHVKPAETAQKIEERLKEIFS